MERAGLTAAVVAGLLAGMAGPAMGQGSWTEEPFPARLGLESTISAVRWDGTAWTQVPMPQVDGTSDSHVNVDDVASRAPDDVWAAVTSTPYDEDPVPHTMRWDGEQWSVVDTPVTEGYLGDLVPVGSELWAMNGSSGAGGNEGSMLRYDGATWRPADPPPTGFPSTGTELEDGGLLAVGSADTEEGHQPFAATKR